MGGFSQNKEKKKTDFATYLNNNSSSTEPSFNNSVMRMFVILLLQH